MFTLRYHLSDGARTSRELRDVSGVSRDTVAKAYEREQQNVLRLGRARATRYAARRALSGLESDTFPVFRVDEMGALNRAGELVTLEASESVWLPDETIIDGLPPEMHDIAPRGFLGRAFAKRHEDLGLPADVTDWSDNHTMIALSRRGEDLPGNLLLGEESFQRFQTLSVQPKTVEDFRVLADAAVAGEHVGSSAGGEQPKFTAFVDGQHRIVKFAANTTDNARRWQDLLLLEHTALQTLREAGIDVANTEVVDADGLRCLLVDRFDRIGTTGRRAVITLAAVGTHIAGSWTDSVEPMLAAGELSQDDFRKIALLDAYGALIGNTDRHHRNLCLFPADGPYQVAPAFDQLPMAYAPPASGNLRNAAVGLPHPTVNTFDVWEAATELAKHFWRRASELPLAESMRLIANEHAARW